MDILTVSEELKRMKELENIGGMLYISELTNNISSSSNSEYYARIIAEKFIKNLVKLWLFLNKYICKVIANKNENQSITFKPK